MKVFTFGSNHEYKTAMLKYYEKDPLFKNNKSGIFKIVCNPKGAFFKNSQQQMLGVCLNDTILCQCVLIAHKNFDALMIAFFEAEPDVFDAVDLLIDYAAKYAERTGKKRLIVSMDGHCNYSVGFSLGEVSVPPVFGESYTPDYYNNYFKDFDRIGFSSYCGDFSEIESDVSAITDRLARHLDKLSVRCADFRNFKAEIARYTELSNRVFDGHWYYYTREYEEDYELFKTMKPLMKPCNLLFASVEGKDIGYILAYPDYNELVSIHRGAGIGTFIRHKLLSEKIHTVKVAEIAVLQEYRTSGAIVTLFSKACSFARKYYPLTFKIVSSWVMNDNHESQNITARFAKHLYGSYSAYEKVL